VNTAVQHAFQDYSTFNTAPSGSLPFGPYAEFQVTSPVVGTFDITDMKDINGTALPNTVITDKDGKPLPQRSNLMVTTAFALPSFDSRLRAFRVYKPVADSSAWSGYRFVADGTPLWVASTPSAAQRNLFTVLPNGTPVEFTAANAGTLASHMNLSATDAAAVIAFMRAQPIGAPVSSTPAIFNPPSLDPPPDADYAGFANDNKNRRTLVFVGTNRGILEAIDARLGVEVWGFIPYNLLAKLKTLRDGQSVGSFDYFVDSSPKIADVKVGGAWKTYLFFGEGPGGTFYQALDVTLAGIGSSISPSSDDLGGLLGYFAVPNRIPLKWSFPSYTSFDPTISTTLMPYGDLKSTATAAEKTVGQTWSDPAIGQVVNNASPYVALVGSGFLPASVQSQVNRGGTRAGTTFYMLSVADGSVFGSRDVGDDNKSESVDDCAVAGDCSKIKNALQSDPLAAGPQGSRFISDAYIGDLDGRIWRLDLVLGSGDMPAFAGSPVKLYDDAASQPIFNSMAEIDVGSTLRYLFVGTGSDLLSSAGVSQQYKLLGLLDQGSSGTVTFTRLLAKVDGIGDDEKVTAFPAVAGDVVFFTTTTFRPASLCSLPDANLYALTFIGGAAYDSTGDDKVTSSDSPKVTTIAGVRATAPFVVDQHLVFGTGKNLQLFGDTQDFNNGVGQAGVRILSWREVR
jgi:Tfp pilus tip-associated adhesin PilY1